jgi:hypothetical protein
MVTFSEISLSIHSFGKQEVENRSTKWKILTIVLIKKQKKCFQK